MYCATAPTKQKIARRGEKPDITRMQKEGRKKGEGRPLFAIRETIDPEQDQAQHANDSSLRDLNLLTTNSGNSAIMFSPVTQKTIAHSTYPYTDDLLSLDSCRPSHVFVPPIPLIDIIVTPFTIRAWEKALAKLVAYTGRDLTWVQNRLQQGQPADLSKTKHSFCK